MENKGFHNLQVWQKGMRWFLKFINPVKDFMRYIDIAQGSLEETKYFILLAKDLKYLNQNQFHSLTIKADEIGKMLCGLHKTLRH